MAEQIHLHGRADPHADPQGQEVVREVRPPLEHPHRHVRRAQEDDGPEAVLHGPHAEPLEERRAQVLQTEPAPGDGPGLRRQGRGRAQGQVEERRHEHGQEGRQSDAHVGHGDE